MLQAHERNLRLSTPLARIARVAGILVMLTSSFDLFLVLQVGGNFRFCQAVSLVCVGLSALLVMRGRVVPTLGLIPLGIWWIVQLFFAPVTDFWPKSFGYCFWLLLDVAVIFAFVQLFSRDARGLRRLLQWYLLSFSIIASFGIVQFCLPLFGLPSPFVTQWFIAGFVARANGMSYEPSYFASYLLIGFVLSDHLRRCPDLTDRDRRAASCTYWLTMAGIVLSSSRSGILFLLLNLIFTQLWTAISAVQIRHYRFVLAHAKSAFSAAAGLVLIGAGIVLSGRILENRPEAAVLLFSGTGLFGSATHSVLDREKSFEDTLTVFAEHPFIGRSLGGVSYAVGALHGEDITSFEESKLFEGMSVFAEALAASGLVGIVPFIAFLVVTIQKPLKLSGQAGPFYRVWMRALVKALLFEWAILQFNQNILRPYLWVHLAILATVYAAARHATIYSRPTSKELTVLPSPSDTASFLRR